MPAPLPLATVTAVVVNTADHRPDTVAGLPDRQSALAEADANEQQQTQYRNAQYNDTVICAAAPVHKQVNPGKKQGQQQQDLPIFYAQLVFALTGAAPARND